MCIRPGRAATCETPACIAKSRPLAPSRHTTPSRGNFALDVTRHYPRGHTALPCTAWHPMWPPPWPNRHCPPVGPHVFTSFGPCSQGEKDPTPIKTPCLGPTERFSPASPDFRAGWIVSRKDLEACRPISLLLPAVSRISGSFSQFHKTSVNISDFVAAGAGAAASRKSSPNCFPPGDNAPSHPPGHARFRRKRIFRRQPQGCSRFAINPADPPGSAMKRKRKFSEKSESPAIPARIEYSRAGFKEQPAAPPPWQNRSRHSPPWRWGCGSRRRPRTARPAPPRPCTGSDCPDRRRN